MMMGSAVALASLKASSYITFFMDAMQNIASLSLEVSEQMCGPLLASPVIVLP